MTSTFSPFLRERRPVRDIILSVAIIQVSWFCSVTSRLVGVPSFFGEVSSCSGEKGSFCGEFGGGNDGSDDDSSGEWGGEISSSCCGWVGSAGFVSMRPEDTHVIPISKHGMR